MKDYIWKKIGCICRWTLHCRYIY